MNKLKGKYELVLAIATIVISLSAFKDELAKQIVDIGILKFTLSQYLFAIIIGFSFSLYLYIIDKAFEDTRWGVYKFFNYTTITAFVIFILLLFSPFVILLAYFINVIVSSVHLNFSSLFKKTTYYVTNSAIVLSVITLSISWAIKYFSNLLKEAIEKFKSLQSQELHRSEKLFNDGYYTNSVIEMYRALENYLNNKLLQRDRDISRQRIDIKLKIAVKEKIFKPQDLAFINELRSIRNEVVHTYAEVSKDTAEKMLKQTLQLLNENKKEL